MGSFPVADQAKLVSRKIERPRDEWIMVPVPPIVSPDLWQMANRSLDKNAQMGRRNAKEPYLLTGLIKCATCGYSYTGGRKRYERQDGTVTVTRHYRCSSRSNRPKHVSDDIGCTQGQIMCHVLDDAVWVCLCDTLLAPELLIQHLERTMHGDDTVENHRQISELERQLRDNDREDRKVYQAYLADAFDEHEFAARRRRLKELRASLEQQLEELKAVELTEEDFEERKRLILAVAENAKVSGLAADAPFEIRQRIVKLLVDKVVLNVSEGWLRIEGLTPGRTDLNSPIENIPTGRDTWLRFNSLAYSLLGVSLRQ